MPFGRGDVPILEVGTIIEALRQHLGGTHDYALHCPRAPLLLGLLHVHTTIGLDHLAGIGGIVSCLFLVGACSGFYNLGWALITCQLFSGVLLGPSMLPEPTGSAHVVVVWLLQMNCT